jgi:hypothetical protein
MLISGGFAGYLVAVLLALLGVERVEVCHVSGNGQVHALRLPPVAAQAHLRHGDRAPLPFWEDADEDGYGDPYAERLACEAPEGAVDNVDDCDDGADFVSPSATDACGDSIDQDCSGDDALCSVEYEGWSLTSGPVEPGATPGTITGRFTFTRLSGDATATRGGGGCMIADLFTADATWSGFSCSSNADCNNPQTYTGPFRYCASPDGSGEPMRCWTRPTDNCARSGFRTPGEYAVNATLAWTPSASNPTTPGSEIPKSPVSGDATGRGEPVRWMVVTCMAAAANSAGCASPDPSQHEYSFGPAWWWTPAEE